MLCHLPMRGPRLPDCLTLVDRRSHTVQGTRRFSFPFLCVYAYDAGESAAAGRAGRHRRHQRLSSLLASRLKHGGGGGDDEGGGPLYGRPLGAKAHDVCAMFLLAYDANEGGRTDGRMTAVAAPRRRRRRRRSTNEEGRTSAISGGADIQRGRGRGRRAERRKKEGRIEEVEEGGRQAGWRPSKEARFVVWARSASSYRRSSVRLRLSHPCSCSKQRLIKLHFYMNIKPPLNVAATTLATKQKLRRSFRINKFAVPTRRHGLMPCMPRHAVFILSRSYLTGRPNCI